MRRRWRNSLTTPAFPLSLAFFLVLRGPVLLPGRPTTVVVLALAYQSGGLLRAYLLLLHRRLDCSYLGRLQGPNRALYRRLRLHRGSVRHGVLLLHSKALAVPHNRGLHLRCGSTGVEEGRDGKTTASRFRLLCPTCPRTALSRPTSKSPGRHIASTSSR